MPRFDPWPGTFPIEEWDPEFRQRERVNLAEEITKLNELRNRVMHGRYLTDDNELAIRLACRMFSRLLEPHVRILEVID